MEQFFGCDAHKKFSWFIALNEEGQYGRPVRIAHERDRMRAFLEALEIGDIGRFPSAQNLTSYAGLAPAARESAGRKRP
jgi:hypothetical protein